MMNLKTFYSIALAFFLTCMENTNSYAQDAKWSVDLTNTLVDVGWIEQSNDGLIIASGAKGIVALNNNTGEQVWHNKELKAVLKESYQNIDGLPLFYAEYAPLTGRVRGVIVNSMTGAILYDTKDDNYRIKTYHLLPEQKAILFEMTQGNKRTLMSFSLRTMEKQWTTDLGEITGLVNKIGNKAVRQSYIDHGPTFTKNANMIVGVNANVYCINQTDGIIIWDYKADKKVKALVYSPLNNSVYMGVKKSKKLIVLNPENGNDITPGKLKLKGSLVDITSDSKDNIVLVETEGFNLIDPKTNDLIWKKSYKIPYLDEVIAFEKGYIAIGKDEKDGSISYVDENGKKIWDTKVKGYCYYAATTAKGVLYISTARSNIIGYDDGKDVWKKDVKFKSIPAVTYDEKEDKVVLFENGTGFKFDLKSGNIDIFAEGIELMNVKKKTPLIAEYRPSGYLLNTDQHISLLSSSGKLVYTKYYPELSTLNFAQMAQYGMNLAGVDIDIAGAMENIETLNRLSKGTIRSSNAVQEGTATTQVVAGAYFGSQATGSATLFETTKTRYSNSKNAKDHKYIMTKDENGQKRIFMVEKDSGKEVKQIPLTEKTPSYVVDEIDNRVFLSEKNKTVACYQM